MILDEFCTGHKKAKDGHHYHVFTNVKNGIPILSRWLGVKITKKEYYGSGTVWSEFPSFKRCNTDYCLWLSQVFKGIKHDESLKD